jgi:hypothetical protein
VRHSRRRSPTILLSKGTLQGPSLLSKDGVRAFGGLGSLGVATEREKWSQVHFNFQMSLFRFFPCVCWRVLIKYCLCFIGI